MQIKYFIYRRDSRIFEDISIEDSTYQEWFCLIVEDLLSMEYSWRSSDSVASICYACSYPLLPDDLHSQFMKRGELSSLLSGFSEEQKKRFRANRRNTMGIQNLISTIPKSKQL